jgi:DNA repair exonuclease SbcCD nuclease subunit
VKFLHTADWQLGARFKQFGERAGELREARFTALRRALEIARDRKVDAFIIAGDLFEDNEVDDVIVKRAVSLFAEFDGFPVFILPGNHDPFIGPASVWNRPSCQIAPKNVRVFRSVEFAELESGFILGSPLLQKKSTVDPSLKLVDLAKQLPEQKIKVGVTHGSPDIPSLREDNDFPIATNAATRAQIDFLCLGHWHSWLLEDNGRMLMPGTPEPDAFGRRDCGSVALIEISERGSQPKIEKVPVATMRWHTFDFNFLETDTARQNLQIALAALNDRAKQSVVRVHVRGTAAREVLTATRTWLGELLKLFPFAQLDDESGLAFTPAELDFLKANHPILAQVLADLDQMAALTIGTRNDSASPDPLSPTEKDRLLSEANIEPAALRQVHFDLARQLLLQNLQEAE